MQLLKEAPKLTKISKSKIDQNKIETNKIIMSEYEYKCNYCSKPLPENGEFVNCSACNNNYHYNPCCSLIETSWKAMSIKAKAEWRCRNCKCKLRSNVQALTLSTERASGKMRTRCEEENSDSNETSAKKYRSDANAILSV